MPKNYFVCKNPDLEIRSLVNCATEIDEQWVKETIEIIDIEVDKTIKGKYDLSDEVGNDEELPF